MNSSSMISDATFYLTRARNARELSRDLESELAWRWRVAGDGRAAGLLARAYQRQELVLAMKYRRSGVRARSLADVARSLGVSRERARQLNERALAKLRRRIGRQAEDGVS